MIVVGIAPGLQHLAYCVLMFPNAGERAMRGAPVDLDILKTRRGSDDEWHKKALVHTRTLGVVFERASPAVIAIGPQLKPKEPPTQIEIVRLVLRAFATGPCAEWISAYYEWRTPDELGAVLAVPGNKARTVLPAYIDQQAVLGSVPTQQAAAIAVAGMLRARST